MIKILSICSLLSVWVSQSHGSTFESVRFEQEIRSGLERPVDLAVTSDGELLLLDQRTLQLKIFDSTGALRTQFGSKALFKKPVAVAAGPDGEIAVADERLKKILVLDESGGVVLSFGSSGTGPGEFKTLSDVAIDRFGFIYTADAGNKVISRYSSSGILLGQSSVAPQIPSALALDAGGRVYVMMSRSVAVTQLFFDGGSAAQNPLSFRYKVGSITGVFVDGKGDIYLSQGAKNNILKFDTSGELLASFGSRGKGPGAFNLPTRLDGTPDGELYVLDSKNKRAQKFSMGGNSKDRIAVSGQSPADVSLAGMTSLSEPISDLVISSEDLQLRLFQDSGRVLKLGLETQAIGAEGKKAGQFRDPGGVDVLPGERIVVADTGNNRFQILNNGGAATVVGERGKEPGFFNKPADVAVNSEGTIYVADTGNARIQIFTDQGIFMHTFGQKGKTRGEELAAGDMFAKPIALALDSRDRVHVLDSDNMRVASFTAKGDPLQQIRGLLSPIDIAVDEDDNIYVADNGCHCVRIFDPNGKPTMRFGSRGEGPGQLGNITALAVAEDMVLVADDEWGNLKSFALNRSGRAIEERLKVSHSFYVPETVLKDAAQMARYRELAMEDVIGKLAALAGASPATIASQMQIDREKVLPGGEVQLMASVPKMVVPVSAAQDPVPVDTQDDAVELAF
ncbi:MAG: 6-bladed beta-propeller [Halioglobus sp.]